MVATRVLEYGTILLAPDTPIGIWSVAWLGVPTASGNESPPGKPTYGSRHPSRKRKKREGEAGKADCD